MRLLVIFFILVLTYSCGSEEKDKNNILSAHYYLTRGECSKAEDLLDKIKDRKTADYVSLKASVYACYAGYSELDLIDNFDHLQVDSAKNIFKSFASLATSNETIPESVSFSYLDKAIKSIITSTAGESGSSRLSKFGSRGGTDLNAQALYMSIVGLGKFLALYGNTDDHGAKGQGAQTNNCFFKYPASPNLGACTGQIYGSPYLDLVADTDPAIKRACQGITYLNNIYDNLKNLEFGSTSESQKLKDILDQLESELGGIDPDTLKLRTTEACILLVNQSGTSALLGFYLLSFEKFLL